MQSSRRIFDFLLISFLSDSLWRPLLLLGRPVMKTANIRRLGIDRSVAQYLVDGTLGHQVCVVKFTALVASVVVADLLAVSHFAFCCCLFGGYGCSEQLAGRKRGRKFSFHKYTCHTLFTLVHLLSFRCPFIATF